MLVFVCPCCDCCHHCIILISVVNVNSFTVGKLNAAITAITLRKSALNAALYIFQWYHQRSVLRLYRCRLCAVIAVGTASFGATATIVAFG